MLAASHNLGTRKEARTRESSCTWQYRPRGKMVSPAARSLHAPLSHISQQLLHSFAVCCRLISHHYGNVRDVRTVCSPVIPASRPMRLAKGLQGSLHAWRVQVLSTDIDLLHPPAELEKQKHKSKRLVQSPNSFFMDVKCQGCFQM